MNERLKHFARLKKTNFTTFFLKYFGFYTPLSKKKKKIFFKHCKILNKKKKINTTLCSIFIKYLFYYFKQKINEIQEDK